MAPSAAQHRRTHNLLLANNLLNLSASPSPFTLILDSLEQSGKPLVDEVIANAKNAKASVIYIAFEAVQKPEGVDTFVRASDSSQWHKQVMVSLEVSQKSHQRVLLVIDSLNKICSAQPGEAPAVLASLITPTASLIAVYHTDIPYQALTSTYAPPAVDLLSYMATTIFTTHSLHHVLARKAARDRSIVEPAFGLAEGEPGIIQGLGANHGSAIVLEMEHRRKSGRGVREWYVLDAQGKQARLSLLEDYPGYQTKIESASNDGDTPQSTFELGLTDQQRRDREGVVLPYFDAQRGNDEGGRILYDMGSEDDFDEEEDEI